MKYLDIEFDYQNKPSLEPEYIPFGVWADAYLSEAARPFRVAVERDQGNVSVFSSFLRDETYEKANYRYMERYVKFLLWSVGGWKVTICGCEETAEKLQKAYVRGGDRDFDAGFFDDTFGLEDLRDRGVDRFFAENMLTGLRGFHGDVSVRIGRRADKDCLDRGIFKDLVIIFIIIRDAEFFSSSLCAFNEFIGNRNQFSFGNIVCQGLGMNTTDSACADDTNTNFIHFFLLKCKTVFCKRLLYIIITLILRNSREFCHF